MVKHFVETPEAAVVAIRISKQHVTKAWYFKFQRILTKVCDPHSSVILQVRINRKAGVAIGKISKQGFFMTGCTFGLKYGVTGLFLDGKAGFTSFHFIVF